MVKKFPNMPKKPTNGRRVHHPIIEAAAEVASDKWWQDYLYKHARGLPRGVYMENYIISFKKKQDDEGIHYKVSTDPAKAYEELKAFFSTHLNASPNVKKRVVRSRSASPPSTTIAGRSPSPNSRKKKVVNPWRIIKKKHLKVGLIHQYKDRLIKQYGLEKDKIDNLNNILYIAELRGMLQESVEMENGHISNIICIKYSDGEFILDEDSLTQKQLNMLYNKSIMQIAPPPDPLKKVYPSKQQQPDAICQAVLDKGKRRVASNKVHLASVLTNAENQDGSGGTSEAA